MRVASLDVIVWLIIFVMVAVAKAWSKSQKQIDEDSSESEEAPPIAPVRRRPTMREGTGALQPQRPRPQPQPAASLPRAAQPSQRAIPRTAPGPVGSPTPREAWRIDPEQIRRFVEQLSGQPQPTPPPPPVAAPPPVHKAHSPAPPPEPEPAAATPETKPAMAETPAETTNSRASQWAEALRDKQNIRNIIISAEIIGPPKAM